jgi:hypothetical protein
MKEADILALPFQANQRLAATGPAPPGNAGH